MTTRVLPFIGLLMWLAALGMVPMAWQVMHLLASYPFLPTSILTVSCAPGVPAATNDRPETSNIPVNLTANFSITHPFYP